MAPVPPPATPEELLRRFRVEGDGAALGRLFDATAPELFRAALALAPDAAAAEDALQETYLAAFRSLERWDEGRRVMPWLFGILRNKLLAARRDAARVPDPRRLAAAAAPGPAEAAEEAEEARRLHSIARCGVCASGSRACRRSSVSAAAGAASTRCATRCSARFSARARYAGRVASCGGS